MKKCILYLVFCLSRPLFISLVCLASDTKVTILADGFYPPYSYSEKSEARGIYADIFRRAFAQMKGYQVTIRPVLYDKGLEMLKKGQAFAIYPPYYRPKERPYIHPYSEPVLEETVVVFCRAEILEQSLKPDWPKNYYGLKIGINSGFELGGEAFWQAVKEGKITIERAKSNQNNIMKLAMRRIDAYINDRISILWTLKQLKKSGWYKENFHAKLLESAVVSSENGHMGFAEDDAGRFPFKSDFIKQLNTTIIKMKENREIEMIVQNYIE